MATSPYSQSLARVRALSVDAVDAVERLRLAHLRGSLADMDLVADDLLVIAQAVVAAVHGMRDGIVQRHTLASLMTPLAERI